MYARFCSECGSEFVFQSMFCSECGTRVKGSDALQSENEHYEQLTEAAENQPVQQTRHTENDSGKIVSSVFQTARLLGNTSFASAASGEMTFSQTIPSLSSSLSEVSSPVKYLLGGAGRLINGFKGTLKDKNKLIPAVAMAFIWLVLTILPKFGVNSSQLRFLSFLTFARGGVGTGVLGAIGGIVGKGIFVFFITSMILPLFSRKKPFAGMRL